MPASFFGEFMKQLIDPQLMLYIVKCCNNTIAFDTETTGITVKDQVCGWVITNDEFSVYVPVRHEAGGNIPDATGFEFELAQAFKERGRLGYRTVGHNLGFDLRISLRHGVVLRSPLEDTMIMRRSSAILPRVTVWTSAASAVQSRLRRAPQSMPNWPADSAASPTASR